ncbi:MAG TPA: DUF5916 domain-containing protein [Panacibacter sp.]|nr:DUF5916 domain-containing protein [Panacibacter sp.]
MFMRIKTAICAITMLTSFSSMAQPGNQRTLEAKRTSKSVKIDGVLNDTAWKDAAVMTDFVEFRPKVGALETPATKTVTYIMYSDEGIYFGGFCGESTKDSIATELKGRDGFGTNDYIGIIFDTYNDKLNGFEYFVTPLGEQWDAKMNPPSQDGNMEDFSWNAVWESGTVITDSGWSFEMFLPFSAIRFGKKDVQDWGVNITRRRRKTEQQNTWSPIDPNVNGFLTQEGTWKGISNIKPPLRLQFSPYFSVYANHYPVNQPGQKNWTSQVNGGLDVKYGINQAFTLDATLIPDFGQVQSDNQVLNLTPFEVKYNENRNFFTEGTELFSKGNLFYSRRIGGSPIHLYDAYNQLAGNETIINNPSESKLINATKISGRMQNGLGIGFLNAVTKAQYATIENTVTKEDRKVLTDPLTNYNVMVLDKTLKYNSSVSFVNTNVWRDGPDYDANVSAGLFELNDKKNTWNLGGKLAVSNRFNYLPGNKTESGFNHELHFGKTSGHFNFNVWQERTDTKFSSDDMGYFTNNNFLNHGAWAGYSFTEPKNWYNRIFLNFNANVSTLSKKIEPIDEKYQSARLNTNLNIQSKKLWWIGSHIDYTFRGNDFYEPRAEGWFFKRGASIGLGSWFESNDSKKYSYSTELFARTYINFYKSFAMDLSFTHNMRFNNRFSLSQSISLQPRFNNAGFTYVPESTNINFAIRKVNTIEHVLSAKYNFNNKMGITFRARHYVSSVENKDFYLLQRDGSLLANTNYHPSVDQNVNFFNVDMVYTWQFAPGSFLNIVWKNAAQNYSDEVEKQYFKNLSNTVSQNNNNNFSLKVIYFLDYLKFKGHVNNAIRNS